MFYVYKAPLNSHHRCFLFVIRLAAPLCCHALRGSNNNARDIFSGHLFYARNALKFAPEAPALFMMKSVISVRWPVLCQTIKP